VLILGVGIAATAFPLGRIITSGFRAMSGLFAGREIEPATPQRPNEVGEEFAYYEPNDFTPDEDEIPIPYDAHEQLAVLMNHIYFVIMIFVVAGIIYAFYLFIRYFHRRRRKSRQGEDADGDEDIALTRNILDDIRDLLPRFGRYSKNAIRRAYAKKVKWHIRRGVNIERSDTTDIIADKIRATEDIDALTAQYEKVRYFQ